MGKWTFRNLVTFQLTNCMVNRDLSIAISPNPSKKCKYFVLTFSFYIVKLYQLSDLGFRTEQMCPF